MSASTRQPTWLLGHEPIGRRPNIRAELKRIRHDPIGPLLEAIDDRGPSILSTIQSRYQDAYRFYYLSFERYLKGMSIAARYSRLRETVGRRQFTPRERALAKQRRGIAKFLEYDIINLLLHSRILLDRAVGLSRFFLVGEQLPSFTSFSEHRKFFCKVPAQTAGWPKYAERIRDHTGWFEMPLKAVRDKFIVHAGPKHWRCMGYPDGGFELDLSLIVPDQDAQHAPLATPTVIRVNALRLSYDIESFLVWFCGFALAALPQGSPKGSKRCKKRDGA